MRREPTPRTNCCIAALMVRRNNNCRGRAETHRQETTMIKDTTQSFEIPNEMRTLAERNVEQAKLAFTDYL
jgi:hypothetical protein